MRQLRWRSMLVWLAGAFPVLLVPGTTVPSQTQGVQTTRLGEALSYPDSRTVSLKYARVVLEVSINGRHTERDNDRTRTETVNFQARVIYTEQPRVSMTAKLVSGKYVSTEVDPTVPDKSVTHYAFALSDSSSTPLGAGQAGSYLSAPVSNRYGATQFGLDAAILTPWSDIPGHLVMTTTGPDGEQTSEEDLPCEVRTRVPYHSSVGATPFAALANSLETAGKDGDDPLIGGIIEAPWSEGGSFGSFSLPVLASSAMAYNMVNTKAAWDAEGWDDPLYPGWLRVTWVLGADAPVGRMTIAPVDRDAYGAWGPAGGAGGAQPTGAAATPERLGFRVSMAPTAAGGAAPQGRMDFWLREVGEGTGGTPDAGQADALRFVPGQADLVIDGENPRHAYTRDGLSLSEFTVEVEALRPDAHGLLQATCDDLHLIAEYEATGGTGIAIPREDAAAPGAEG